MIGDFMMKNSVKHINFEITATKADKNRIPVPIWAQNLMVSNKKNIILFFFYRGGWLFIASPPVFENNFDS